MKFTLTRFGVALCLLGSGAGVALVPLAAVQGQPLSSWKTVMNKEAGVSILMPPGAKVEPEVTQDEKTGAKMIMVQASSETPTALYFMAVMRLSKTALEELRQATPAGKEPLDALYQTHVQPPIDRLMQKVREDPKHNTLTRKPFTWQGMKGEDIVAKVAPTQKDKGGVMQIRMVKNQTGFLILFAVERTATADSNERRDRFFRSLTLLPDAAPLDAPLPDVPVAPAPEAPVPDAPQPAPPVAP